MNSQDWKDAFQGVGSGFSDFTAVALDVAGNMAQELRLMFSHVTEFRLNPERKYPTSRLAGPVGATALYFILLLVVWIQALKDLKRMGKPRFPVLSLFLFGFAIYNFYDAWVLIVQWLKELYTAAKNDAAATALAETGSATNSKFIFEDWFVDVDLFVGAYELVITTFAQWFWSSQLLHFVSGLVVFTFLEFHRSGAKFPASNFWLGCAGAISLNFPYVLYVVLNANPDRRRDRTAIPLSWLLVGCVLIGNVATVLVPRVELNLLGPVLAVLHVSLILPLLAAQFLPVAFFEWKSASTFQRRLGSIWVLVLYAVLAGFAVAAQAFNFLTALATLTPQQQGQGGSNEFVDVLLALKTAFCVNSCQCSISNDVARTSVAFMVFLVFGAKDASNGGIRLRWRFLLALLTPILSVGATFPIWAAAREVVLRYAPYSLEERVARMLLRYDPTSSTNAMSRAKKIVDLERMPEEKLVKALTDKYGPEPDAFPTKYLVERTERKKKERASVRQQVVSFYKSKGLAEKIKNVDKILDAWKDRPVQQLYDELVKKYGPVEKKRKSPSKPKSVAAQEAAEKVRDWDVATDTPDEVEERKKEASAQPKGSSSNKKDTAKSK